MNNTQIIDQLNDVHSAVAKLPIATDVYNYLSTKLLRIKESLNMANKKTITDLTGSVKGGKVLTGCKKSDTVMFKGKKHKFIEYRDFGFSCIIKPTKGKRILVFGSEITKP